MGMRATPAERHLAWTLIYSSLFILIYIFAHQSQRSNVRNCSTHVFLSLVCTPMGTRYQTLHIGVSAREIRIRAPAAILTTPIPPVFDRSLGFQPTLSAEHLKVLLCLTFTQTQLLQFQTPRFW